MQITVDGQTESVAFTVAPATYNLSVSPQKLIQHVGTDVTFTIKRNNKTVSGLAATFATNVDLGLNGTTRNTDGSGRITLRLTPTATGTKTVQVTVDGQALNAGLQVDPPSYTLETSDSLSQHDPKDVTFTVKRNGQLVSRPFGGLYGQRRPRPDGGHAEDQRQRSGDGHRAEVRYRRAESGGSHRG